MKLYGDITKLNGYELDPVDLIVGGSPCQDVSQAGFREGLKGERSGLFFEMIRIIREMKNATNTVRYGLFENVPGLLSSNDGRDFQIVLTEYARLIEPDAPDVPMPKEGWAKSGILLVGNGSISYRVTDAQFWGVPQRRRRIALIADFRGQSAYEILFERKGSERDHQPGETQREGTAGNPADSTGTASIAVFDSQPYHACKEFDDGIMQTVNAQYGTGGNNQRLVVATMQGFGDYAETDVASSCKQRDHKDATDQVCRIQSDSNGNYVRRLTPTEAERLQGFPDRWTDIPGATISARFRSIGNSIALPFWEFLAHRFAEIGNVKTIGSLFDGISGFPLVFKRAGCETLWTSEIDPFCQKVCQYHLDNGDLQPS